MKDEMIVVADTHLTRRDAELSGFVEFLVRRGGEAGTVAHLGDLFNIWLGKRRFEMDHMTPVLSAFRSLRQKGVRTILAEGNREFHPRRHYEGDAFTVVAERSIDVTVGGARVRMAHGDLVNVRDRQYRAWRWFSKSWPVWAAFGALPGGPGIRLAERLEARLRGTNLRQKTSFPDEAAREFADRAFREGVDLVLVGHFHEERVIPLGHPGGERRTVAVPAMVVLPDWRSSHRYLRVSGDGSWAVEDWRA